MRLVISIFILVSGFSTQVLSQTKNEQIEAKLNQIKKQNQELDDQLNQQQKDLEILRYKILKLKESPSNKENINLAQDSSLKKEVEIKQNQVKAVVDEAKNIIIRTKNTEAKIELAEMQIPPPAKIRNEAKNEKPTMVEINRDIKKQVATKKSTKDIKIPETINSSQELTSSVETNFVVEKNLIVEKNIQNKVSTNVVLPDLGGSSTDQLPSISSAKVIEDKATKLLSQGPSLIQSPQTGGLQNSVIGEAKNQITQQGTSVLNNLLSTQRGTTEIGATTMQNGLPIWNVLLVRPIYESADRIHTTFTQMSAFTQNSRTTGNFGLGYRQLVADKKILLGTNAFYDYEFPYGNQRSSLGGEIRSSVGELNLNYYVGTSGWVSGANGLQEKSLGGYNAEFAVALPYMPTTQLRVNSFSWTGVSGLPNTSGTQYSMTGAIWWGLNLDLGRYQYNDSALPNSNYAKLYWIFGGDISPNQKQFRLTDYAYKFESMENRRYEKVRRENLIVKAQRSSTFTVGIIGY